jgi:hypothetical protein
VPQVVQAQPVGQQIGPTILGELGDRFVRGADGWLEAVGDELGLAQRATTRRGEHQSVAASRPIGQVDAQLLSQRTG